MVFLKWIFSGICEVHFDFEAFLPEVIWSDHCGSSFMRTVAVQWQLFFISEHLEHFRTIKHISKHFRTFQNISEHFRTSQTISEHIRRFQNISNFENILDFSEHFRLVWNISERVFEAFEPEDIFPLRLLSQKIPCPWGFMPDLFIEKFAGTNNVEKLTSLPGVILIILRSLYEHYGRTSCLFWARCDAMPLRQALGSRARQV